MRKHFAFAVISLLTVAVTTAQRTPDKTLLAKADGTLKTAADQYAYLATKVTPGAYPKTWYEDKQQLETSGSGWWCSGFYPGTLLYLDEAVNAAVLKQEALDFLADLKKEQFNTSTHDLGFMLSLIHI